MNMDEIRRVGIAAAYKGAKVLLDHFGKLTEVRKKGAIDLVTQADIESEKAIISAIRDAFPDHAVLAEESGLEKGDAKNRWIVDPLDGTTNFAHELGLFCVSIAFASNGEVLVGIVLNPVSEELFLAEKGKGATLNGSPISVSKINKVSDGLLVTGFPYNHPEIIDEIMARFARCIGASQGVRRLGSAAMDLCYVACGRFEGFWEQNLKPWDTAAGMLIAEEAGGVVTDFSGAPFDIHANQILATNGKIHAEMKSLLK
jgi:myo-inositol-1(or 4)-monophosphatase